MTDNSDQETFSKIKRAHGRITVIAGVTMGITLCIYFFTFSMLIDRGATLALWFELITSVLFLFGLIFLKRVALFITRVMLSLNADCRYMLKGLKVADLEKN